MILDKMFQYQTWKCCPLKSLLQMLSLILFSYRIGPLVIILRPSRNLKICCAAYGLEQLINEPTRVTVQSSTLIDHNAVSNTENSIGSGVLKIALSDEYLVYATRKFQCGIKCQQKSIRMRQMKKINEKAFLLDLEPFHWQFLLQYSPDSGEIVHSFASVLSAVIQKHAPMVEKRVVFSIKS